MRTQVWVQTGQIQKGMNPVPAQAQCFLSLTSAPPGGTSMQD